MKNEIQKKILEEMEGMSNAQQREYTEKLISSDPVLAPYLKRDKENTNDDVKGDGQ